jgi:sulfoxide reductase catalytic subunit YedY
MIRSRFQIDSTRQDITPPDVFFGRREFLKTTVGATLLTAPIACGGEMSGRQAAAGPDPRIIPPRSWPDGFSADRNESYSLPDGLRSELTPRLSAASHNNYYEFLPGRGGDVWPHTSKFSIEPWAVEIAGECAKPRTLDLDDLMRFAHEERLYHFRCVERWAMNIPWTGFPLRALVESAEPNGHAKFVRFSSPNRPAEMPGMRSADYYPWPYHEALRMDEAVNDLAMVVTGVYGEPLPKQHGAPARIIVPWKYGYKNPKSIVRIEFVREQPKTFWQIQPHEYGFLSNVNPNIPHPRWSQAESYWLGPKRESFPTAMFNGYARYVADMYPDEPTTPQKAVGPGGIARWLCAVSVRPSVSPAVVHRLFGYAKTFISDSDLF